MNQKEAATSRLCILYYCLLYGFLKFLLKHLVSVTVGNRLLDQMKCSSYPVCQMLYIKLKNTMNFKDRYGANPESENINLIYNIFVSNLCYFKAIFIYLKKRRN